MKVICTQENLKKGLAITSRISSGSTTLPILNNILLKTDKGILRLSSTNLEMGVNTWIRCKVEEEGGLSVPAKTFTDLINNLPNDNITLTAEDNHLIVESTNYKTKIKGLGPDEFPLIPQLEDQNPIEISNKDLKTAVAQVAFAAAYSETQPEISGILFAFEPEGLKVVATDRYRLGEKTMPLKSGVSKSLIIPNKAVQELARVLSNQDQGTTTIFFSQNQVMFKVEETELTSRLIDAQYPEYKEIVPDSFNTEVVLNTDQLSQALRTTGIFTQTGSNVVLEFAAPDYLTISASSGEVGESKVSVPCQVEGDSGSIIFNHKYILDCLSVIGTKEVTLKIVNENAPAVIVSKELPGYMYLAMPIKL